MKARRTIVLLTLIVSMLCSCCAVAQISENVMWEQKICDGSVRTFTFSFTIQAATDVAVWTVDTTTTPYTSDELTSGTDYTLSVYNGRYPATGGTILTTTAYPSTTAVIITTDIDLTQSGALSSGAWNPVAVQYMINKSRLIDNEQDRRLRQTIHNPPSINPSVSGELPGPGQAGYLYRDANGAPSLASGLEADPNLERLATNALIQWLADLTDANNIQGLAALDPNTATGGDSGYEALAVWSPISREWDAIAITTLTHVLWGLPTVATFRDAIGVKINEDVQAWNAQLQAIADLSPSNEQVIVFTGATTAEVRDVNTLGGGGSISDDAYPTGWDADTTGGASRHQLYQVISGLGGGHDAVTIGTANGLSLAGQILSLAAATTGNAGAMTAAQATALAAIDTEAELEALLDLQDLQGAVTDAQVPDDITITESDPTALKTAGTDNIKDTHVDWGTGAGQVSADDIPDGSTNAIPTLTQESNWNTAYGWGDHSTQNYLDQDATSANVDSLLAAADYAAMRALLDLEAGTDFYSMSAADSAFQAASAALTTYGGIPPSSAIQTFLGYADLAAIKAGLSVDDLVTLSGVADGATHLGTFTGSTITDNQTVKAALQLLETAVEAAGGGHDPVTLGTANGLSLSTQELSLAAATSGSAGAMTAAQVTALEAIDTEAELEALLELEDLQGTLSATKLASTLDLSGKTLTLPPRVIFCVNIKDIDDTCDDIKIPYPVGMTLTQVTAICTGGTNVVGRLYEVDGDGDDSDAVGIESSDWTFTTTETEDTAFNNATLDAGDYLQWDTTSVSGSVTNFMLCVWGRES